MLKCRQCILLELVILNDLWPLEVNSKCYHVWRRSILRYIVDLRNAPKWWVVEMERRKLKALSTFWLRIILEVNNIHLILRLRNWLSLNFKSMCSSYVIVWNKQKYNTMADKFRCLSGLFCHNILFDVHVEQKRRKILKGSQLCAFCPQAIVYCYLEFKLGYLKNVKLFLIRVKELFEPIVLRKKGNGFLLFLKAFSWEIDLWVTLGDFMVNLERKSLFNWKSIRQKRSMVWGR